MSYAARISSSTLSKERARVGIGLERRFLLELAEFRWMQSGTKTKILAKTHNQRSPLFWIDTIWITGNDQALMNVYKLIWIYQFQDCSEIA